MREPSDPAAPGNARSTLSSTLSTPPRATRRRFLTVSAAATVLPACVTPPGSGLPPAIAADVEPPDAWSPPGAVDAAQFPSGVQVGDVNATSALLAAQTTAGGLALWLSRGRAGVWE